MFRRTVQQLVQPIRHQLAQLTESTAGQQSGRGHELRFGSKYRQLFSSAEGSQGGAGNKASPPKSIMDAGDWGSGGAASSVLGNAAKRVRASAAAEQASAGGAGGGKSGRSIFGFIFDVTLYTTLAAVTAGGIAYTRYSIPEVEDALKEAEQQEQQDASIMNQAWVQLLRQYLAIVVPMDQRVSQGHSDCCN